MTRLLVASSGGHLQQLYRLRMRLPAAEQPVVWATYDGAQGRSLLAQEEAYFLPYIGARQPAKVLRAAVGARKILELHEVCEIISTGSQVALAFAMANLGRQARFHFVESAARADGPSLTGRLIRRMPHVEYYMQYADVARRSRALFAGSVFDGFTPAELPTRVRSIRRVVVALGTFRGYGFLRLVNRLRDILPTDAEVLWQVGDTDVADLGIDGRREIPSAQLSAAMAAADVVVSHAGVGSALAALQVGRVPVLVPRRQRWSEHVDDHQVQIARQLSELGLAITRDASALAFADLQRASAMTVVDASPPMFKLRGYAGRKG